MSLKFKNSFYLLKEAKLLTQRHFWQVTAFERLKTTVYAKNSSADILCVKADFIITSHTSNSELIVPTTRRSEIVSVERQTYHTVTIACKSVLPRRAWKPCKHSYKQKNCLYFVTHTVNRWTGTLCFIAAIIFMNWWLLFFSAHAGSLRSVTLGMYAMLLDQDKIQACSKVPVENSARWFVKSQWTLVR